MHYYMILFLTMQQISPSHFQHSVIVMSSNEINKSQVFKRVLRPRKNKIIQTQDSNNDNTTQTLVITKPCSKIKQKPFSLTRTHSITTKDALFLEKTVILSPAFYRIDALDLAPLLLGKYLRRDNVVLRITEVEAYRANDSACHGRFGVTTRTAPMANGASAQFYIVILTPYNKKEFSQESELFSSFQGLRCSFGPGGHAYVYLCYGLHTMLNIVADHEGVGAAVLIRSCAPVAGLETIQERRGQNTEKPILLSGPGKVGQALGISTEWSNHPLFTPGGLEILDGPKPEKILVGPRVGIEYASTEDVNALWRFAIADTPWISAPKNTLRTL